MRKNIPDAEIERALVEYREFLWAKKRPRTNPRPFLAALEEQSPRLRAHDSDMETTTGTSECQGECSA